MKLTKAKLFSKLFNEWCIKLNVPLIPIKIDNRYDCRVCVLCEDNGDTSLIINSKQISYWSDGYLHCGVFHEIGHMINNLPYDTKEEQIYSEIRAESFALTLLKVNYPELYKENKSIAIKRLNNRRWCRENYIHAEMMRYLYKEAI